jgi:hypothetical protein
MERERIRTYNVVCYYCLSTLDIRQWHTHWKELCTGRYDNKTGNKITYNNSVMEERYDEEIYGV